MNALRAERNFIFVVTEVFLSKKVANIAKKVSPKDFPFSKNVLLSRTGFIQSDVFRIKVHPGGRYASYKTLRRPES